MAWISGNRALTQAESDNNGNIVASFFLAQGWSKESVAAITGSMYAESYINPGLWEEGMPEWGRWSGYGLVQWTPASELLEVCDYAHLGDYTDGTVQLQAIMVEYATTVSSLIQWIPTYQWPISFQQWATNSVGYSVDDLTQAFIDNYLRPADPHQPRYQAAAQRWYTIITTGDYPDTPTPTPTPGPGPQPPGPQPGLPIDFTQPWSVLLLKGYNGRRQRVFYGRR